MTGRRTGRTDKGHALPTVVALISAVAVIGALVAYAFGAGGGQSEASPAAESSSAAPETDPQDKEHADQAAKKKSQQAKNNGKKPQQKQQNQQKRQDQQKQQRNRSNPTPDVYVEVYNNSSVKRLAATIAAQLQGGGWNVVGVDNWRGNIPASTVYHPESMARQARRLAQALGIDRVRGAVAPMKFDRLTVILTADAA